MNYFNKEDLNCLVVPAMLFALQKDKEGFVAETVTKTLIRNCKYIRHDIRCKMEETIMNSINADENNLMDHILWSKVLKAFNEISKQ